MALTTPPFPVGKFDVLLADPPWSYGNSNFGEKGQATSDADSHYPTMTLDEMKGLPVSDIAAENAMLFLWTTGPFLMESNELALAWGFGYVTAAFVWNKMIPNPGNYTLSECEFVLAFKRGKRPDGERDYKQRQLLSERRGSHSAKPDEIRLRIERMYPSARRLEMFARERVEGWTAWGLEASGERVLTRKKMKSLDLE